MIDFSVKPCIDLYIVTSVARDPSKRRVKPTPTVELIPLTLESESEDSDFKIEDDSDSASGSSSDSSDESESENSEGISESEQMTVVNGSVGPTEEGQTFAFCCSAVRLS